MQAGEAGDGNGWVRCARGHRHWGRFGACGLLLTDRSGQHVVLQQRSAQTHQGDTWAVPGGARDSTEDYVTAALREAEEEAGIPAAAVRPIGWRHIDHGGWSYTTVVGRARTALNLRAANWESVDVRWVPVDEVDGMALHPGFADAWPGLRRAAFPVTVIVDERAHRVAGSHRWAADDWRLVRAGMNPADLPASFNPARLDRLLPRFVVVSPSAAAPEHLDAAEHWPARLIEQVHAAPSGAESFDAVLAVVAASSADGESVVVTEDAAIVTNLPPGVWTPGTAWLDSALAGGSAPHPR